MIRVAEEVVGDGCLVFNHFLSVFRSDLQGWPRVVTATLKDRLATPNWQQQQQQKVMSNLIIYTCETRMSNCCECNQGHCSL